MALTDEFINFLSEEELRKTQVGNDKTPKEPADNFPEIDPKAAPQQVDKKDASGNSIHEFIGQSLWGFLDSASWGTLEVGETVAAAAGVTDDNAIEKYLALGAEGDWEDLTGGGKAGYIIGSGLGMLPTFGWAGKMTSAAAKGINLGAKALEKKQKGLLTEFITEKMANNAIAKSIASKADEGVDVVGKLIGEGSKLKQVSNGFVNPLAHGYTTLSDDAIKAGMTSMRAEMGEMVSRGHLADNVAKVLKDSGINATEQEAFEVSEAIFRLVKSENPSNVRHAIAAMLGPKLGDRATELLSAYATDALLVGTHHGVTMMAANATKFGLSQVIDADVEYEGAGEIMMKTLEHGFYGGFIGPMRFISGGKGSRIISDDIAGIVRRHRKAFKKLDAVDSAGIPLYNIKSKRAMLKLLYNAAEGETGILNKLGVTKAFNINNLDKMSESELNAILQKARDIFPKELNKLAMSEIPRDIWESMPRMIAGTAAMNLPNIMEIVKHRNLRDAATVLGTEPEEIAANLLTGMVFSKRGDKLRKKGKFWSDMSESNLHFAENIDKIRKMEAGLDAVGMGNNQINALIQSEAYHGLNRINDLAQKSILSDPAIKEVLNVVNDSIKNKEKVSADEINEIVNAGGQVFSHFINDAINDVNSDSKLTAEEKATKVTALNKARGMHDALIEHQRSFNPENVDEIPISREEFNLMLSKLAKPTVDGKEANSASELSALLKDRADIVFEQQTNSHIAVKMNFLHEMFKELGYSVGFDQEAGVLRIPESLLYGDVLEFGSINNDYVLSETLRNLIWKAKNIGLIELTSDATTLIKADRAKAEKIRDMFDEVNHQLMVETYGADYRDQGRWTDLHADTIMASDASWAAYHMYRQHRNVKTLEHIVTGEGASSVPADIASKIRTEIFDTMAGKNIEWDFEGIPADQVGELQTFANNLGRYLKYQKPIRTGAEKHTVKAEALVKLKDLLTPVIGDTFNDTRAFEQALELSVDRFAKSLGASDLNHRYDVRKALVELIHGGLGSKESRSQKVRLPSLDAVKKNLMAKHGNDLEAVRDDLKFYEEILLALDVSKSKGLVEIDNSLQKHPEGKDWEVVIREARDAADRHLYELALNGSSSRLVNEATSLVRKLTEKRLLDPDMNNEIKGIFTSLQMASTKLYDMVESALRDGNITSLHALSKEYYKVHEVLETLKESRSYTNDVALAHREILKDIIGKMNESKTMIEFEQKLQENLDQVNVDRAETKSKGNRPRISLNEFMSKYNLSPRIARDLYRLGQVYHGRNNADEQFRALASLDSMIFDSSGMKGLGRDFMLGNASSNIDNFIRPWADKLINDMVVAHSSDKSIKVPSIEEAVIDVRQAIVDGMTNSSVAKVIEYRDGFGRVSDTYIANWVNKGIKGLFDGFNLWDLGYILKSGGKIDGYEKSSFGSEELSIIDARLESGDFSLSPSNLIARLTHQEQIKIASDFKGEYIRLAIDEGTSIILKTGKALQDRVRGALSIDSISGEMAPLRALLHKKVAGTKGYDRLVEVIDSGRSLDRDQIKQLIHHARLLNAFPHKITEMYNDANLWAEGISYDPKVSGDIWKRLKMEQTKSGIIANPVFVKAAMDVMRNVVDSNSNSFFSKVLQRAQNVINADGTGTLKVATINDSHKASAGDVNKYDVYDRYKVAAEKMLNDGLITEAMRDDALSKIEGKEKELTDAATYVRLDPMVAFASIMGAKMEQFTFDSNGDISGLNFALKPSVAHSKILDNGGHEVYYNKTSFHYDPIMDRVMADMGVDMLAFRSGNKVNNFSSQKGVEGADRYLIDTSSDLSAPWANDLTGLVGRDGQPFNANNPEHIVELPLESIMLKNMGMNHLPPLSNSMGVHQNSDNGIANWAGIDARVSKFDNMWSNIFSNPYKTTRLAKEVTGMARADGNLNSINTGLMFYLNAGGTADAPWIRRELEQGMVSYYLNGGAIAGAEAKQGNYNVMIPERGNFQQAFRYNGRQFIYGEGMPSFVEGNQPISLFGITDGLSNSNVGAFIIKRSQRVGWDLTEVAPGQAPRKRPGDRIDGAPDLGEYVIFSVDGKPEVMIDGYRLLEGGELVSENGAVVVSGANTPKLMRERAAHRKELTAEIEALHEFKQINPQLTYAEAMHAITREDVLGIKHRDIVESIRTGSGDLLPSRQIAESRTGQPLYLGYDVASNIYHVIRKTVSGGWVKETNHNELREVQKAFSEIHAKSTKWMGATDLRMPANGSDNVVSKSRGQFNIDFNTGEVTFQGNLAKEMGPVKMMNYTDVDRKQDADHDWDKSASYTAVHGKFLKNVLGTAGHEQISSDLTKEFIHELVQTSGVDIDLTNPSDYTAIHSQLADVNMFRGKVVKAHQIATYIVNAFGGYDGRAIETAVRANNEINLPPSLGTINVNGRAATLVLRNPGEIVNNKTFIRDVVKKFLDYYKNPPENINNREVGDNIMDSLYFGEHGLFKLVDAKDFTDISSFGNVGEFVDFKAAVKNNILGPLAKYLNLNKGETVGSDGVSSPATFDSFVMGYQALRANFSYPTIKDSFEMRDHGAFTTRTGRAKMWDFVNNKSQAPFDVAMKGLHNIHARNEGTKSEQHSIINELINVAFHDGFDIDGFRGSLDNRLNRTYEYYVKNQAKVIELTEINKIIGTLESKKADMEVYNKNPDKHPDYNKLASRIELLKSEKANIEAILSTFDIENTMQIKVYNKEEGAFVNNHKTPIVTYNKKNGNRQVYEVIHPGQRNKKPMSEHHVGVINGRRFEIVDPVKYRDMKASFNAFGGLARHGKETMTQNRKAFFIDPLVKKFQAEVIELTKRHNINDTGRDKFAEKSVETEALLHHYLGKLSNNPLDVKQFLFNLLTPRPNKDSIAITSSSHLPGTHTTFDYAFKENYWATSIYKYLSARAIGEKYTGGISESAAIDLIETLTRMRTIESMKLYDPTFHISNLDPTLTTQKLGVSDIQKVTTEMNPLFLEKIQTLNLYESEIFNNLLGWMNGKKTMTPTQLHRLTDEFINLGIEPGDIFFNQSIEIGKDGTVSKYGESRMGHFLSGGPKFGNTGQFGRPGGKVDQAPSNWIEREIKRRCKKVL